MADEKAPQAIGKQRKVIFIFLAAAISVIYAGFVLHSYAPSQDSVAASRPGLEMLMYQAFYEKRDAVETLDDLDVYLGEAETNADSLAGLFFLKAYLATDGKITGFKTAITELPQTVRTRLADDIYVWGAILAPDAVSAPRLISAQHMRYPLPLALYYRQNSNPEAFREGPKALYYVLKELGKYCHNKSYVEAALEVFGKIENQPGLNDPEVEAWSGSATTMRALTVDSVIKKVKYVNQGVARIDQAVLETPANMVIRAVRAYNGLSLPSFFRRADVAYEDLLYLWDKYSNKQTCEFLDEQFEVRTSIPEKKLLMELYGFASRYRHFSTRQANHIRDTLELLMTH